jgi:hypothetical protein
MLASGTQDHGFAPDRSRRIFPAGKIHSMLSFVQYQNNKVHDTNKYKKKIPVGARFFAHVQTGPGAHPASCTMGNGSFLGKAAGAWC